MSFSYKTLNSNDIALTSYIANKQWEVNNTTLSQNGITIYIGENLPISKVNPFDPTNDSQTGNEEYRRLIFDSIKNLYYQNYVSGTLSGDFYQSSSFFNYEQSTLVSGTIRNLPTISGSINNFNVYDISSSLYDTNVLYDSDKGSKIVVISIDQNVFGSGLSPNTVNISGSTYNLQDDGQGNIMDTLNSIYIGNVFYSQGLIVITNQDYLCIFGAPPTTINDYFSYLNTNYNPQTLDILANDIVDCGALNQDSVQITTVPGFSFPNYTLIDGSIVITPNQSSIIPGNYQLNYTVANLNGIRSNTSSINLTITSQSLQITNLVSSSVCYASTASVPVTFSINYGVPPYSYSLDNEATYTGIPGFFNKTASGSITASSTNSIYIKDYMGTVLTQSFSSWYPSVTYTSSITKLPCSSTDTTGKFTVDNTGGYTGVSASFVLTGSADSYYVLPKQFTTLSTGSYTLKVKDSYGCVTSSIITLSTYTALTSSITQSNVTCYGASNGSISVAFTNVVDTLIVNMTDTTGSYIYQNVNLSNFPNNTVTASNLVSGSYNLIISASGIDQCQSYNNTFVLTSPTQPTFNVTSSYINSSSNAIIFSGSNGTAPYTYYAVETSSNVIYSSTTNPVVINGLTGGTFNTFIVDNNGCVSTSSLLTSYGRTYNYTGSYCVLTGSDNTGYVSSSGIQQNFNSGPYSGSLVTSSYSSGSTLFGPIVNFKQLFVSGTIDGIQPLGLGTTDYRRYYYDATICPPGGCYAPVLVTATALNCTTNWTSSYSVTYNSSSTLATTTIIEYSNNSGFSPKATHSINNASPVMTPFYTQDDFGYFNIPNTVMYFRAYNSCSIGTTSSYSNVLTASCATAPAPTIFTVTIKNKSGTSLNYNTGSTSYAIADSGSANITFTSQTKNINLYTIHPVKSGLGGDEFLANVSSSNDVNNNVYTQLHCPIDPTTYPDYTVSSEYINGGYDFIFIDDISNTTPDLTVYIDRDIYTNSGVITLTIKPYFSL